MWTTFFTNGDPVSAQARMVSGRCVSVALTLTFEHRGQEATIHAGSLEELKRIGQKILDAVEEVDHEREMNATADITSSTI